MSKVPTSVLFTRPEQSTPAVVTENIFIPDNGTNFSYNGNQFINIPLRTAVENAFLDARHSFLRVTIQNPNNFPLAFDGLASSIIRKFTITGGGITLSNVDYYNKLVDLLFEHWGSDDYQREMAILCGNQVRNGTNWESGVKAGVGIIGGNNLIPANGQVQVCIPIISSFLLSKMMPLCFMANAFLTLNLQLEDPRVAFIMDGTNAVAQGTANANLMMPFVAMNGINTGCPNITNVEYVSQIVSFRDNSLVQKLGQMLVSEGLFIHGTDYSTYINNITPTAGNGSSALTFNIPDRSQSMKYIMNAFYYSQPDVKFSQIQSNVAGTTSYQVRLGGVNYPQTKPVYYNGGGGTAKGNFIHPYLILQKISSNGYFSTNNHTSVELNTFTRQSVNSLMENQPVSSALYDAMNLAGLNGAPVGQVPALAGANTIYNGSFVQTMSFESFPNANGVECGINTALLAVPINIDITRDLTTYQDTMGYGLNNTGVDVAHVASPSNCTGFPTYQMITWVAKDVIWRLNPTGLWESLS